MTKHSPLRGTHYALALLLSPLDLFSKAFDLLVTAACLAVTEPYCSHGNNEPDDSHGNNEPDDSHGNNERDDSDGNNARDDSDDVGGRQDRSSSSGGNWPRSPQTGQV